MQDVSTDDLRLILETVEGQSKFIQWAAAGIIGTLGGVVATLWRTIRAQRIQMGSLRLVVRDALDVRQSSFQELTQAAREVMDKERPEGEGTIRMDDWKSG